MYETTKIIKKLRESDQKTLIRNVGNRGLKIKNDTVENVRVNLFYLFLDLATELRVDVSRDKLEKEIFGWR